MSSYGAESEVEKLRKVLIHKPGEEFKVLNKGNAKMWLFDEPVDKDVIYGEYLKLKDALRNEGVEIVETTEGVDPNQCFVRDVGFVTGKGLVLGNFRAEVRKGEERVVAEKLMEEGIPLLGRVREPGFLEGGDVFFITPRDMVVGVGERSNREGAEQVFRLLRRQGLVDRIHYVELKEAFHLDLAFNMASWEVAGIYREAVGESLMKLLKALEFEIIEVPREDFRNLALNWLTLEPGKVLFLNGDRANRVTRRLLEAAGIDVVSIELNEALKGRGGLRCLTLPILRS